MNMMKFLTFGVLLFGVGSFPTRVCAAETPPPPGSSIHGFTEVAFKSAYITPRGLVVSKQGLTTQILHGLVLGLWEGAGVVRDVALVTGLWADFNSEQRHTHARTLNELDYFGGLSAKLSRRFEAAATYVVFLSPPHNFKPEHNLEFKLAYADGRLPSDTTLNPYAKLFWALQGDSTVLLGRRGKTYDVELGAVPSRTWRVGSRIPVTTSLPTFLTLGGPGFFGGGQALGVFSTGPKVSVPLNLIPARLGSWHADAGLAYFHLANDNLVQASRILGNGGRRDEWVTSAHLGMGF